MSKEKQSAVNKILLGDCVELMRELGENSVDSIVTDPPGGISFMGKAWDSNKGGRDNWIKWMQEVASECLRVIKPGGHVLVWAIPRTSHWTTTAWENAGFEIRDKIAYYTSKDEKVSEFYESLTLEQKKLLGVIADESMVAHIFGSGFPKSLNIGKKIDQIQGNEREVNGVGKAGKGFNKVKGFGKNTTKGGEPTTKWETTKGTSEWEGYGTALKPAREDWILMRKPLSEKSVAENCLKWKTGGINIEQSRVETYDIKGGGLSSGGATNKDLVGGDIKNEIYGKGYKRNAPDNTTGRFPANLIHDNSEQVRSCFPDTKSGKDQNPAKTSTSGFTQNGIRTKDVNYGDSGNASRFFKSIIYNAKASKSERNKGCENLVSRKGSEDYRPNDDGNKGIQSRLHGATAKGSNNHSTVKPVKLMQYLINMITPKGGVVLDPFAGSGTTGLAAKENGFQYILMEKEAEYIEIIKSRLGSTDKKTTEWTLFDE